jgi:hypothetical protein
VAFEFLNVQPTNSRWLSQREARAWLRSRIGLAKRWAPA